jgi:hypothetical protein
MGRTSENINNSPLVYLKVICEYKLVLGNVPTNGDLLHYQR